MKKIGLTGSTGSLGKTIKLLNNNLSFSSFKGHISKKKEVKNWIENNDFDLDKLSKMALTDPSTGGNPKKLTLDDMKIMYQHSMSGELF